MQTRPHHEVVAGGTVSPVAAVEGKGYMAALRSVLGCPKWGETASPGDLSSASPAVSRKTYGRSTP